MYWHIQLSTGSSKCQYLERPRYVWLPISISPFPWYSPHDDQDLQSHDGRHSYLLVLMRLPMTGPLIWSSPCIPSFTFLKYPCYVILTSGYRRRGTSTRSLSKSFIPSVHIIFEIKPSPTNISIVQIQLNSNHVVWILLHVPVFLLLFQHRLRRQ